MTAPYLVIDRLAKSYGSFPVFADIGIDIAEGEFVCLLGPSGCGKTTLLLCLAGLEEPTSGAIRKGGRDITRLPTAARDVGIVFQSYALFPSLDVAANIGFGLVNAGVPRAKIADRVRELVAMFSLEGHEAKYPAQLSGGQQQRVALARSLAVSPSLLLLDEPLSALDAQVRGRLRREIRDVQRRVGLTTVMVTHDQEEAQTMADRIVLMNAGRIEQIGTPWELYNQPKSVFVADFVGAANILSATVCGADAVDLGGVQLRAATAGLSGAVQCVIRPEDVAVLPAGAAAGGPNAFDAVIGRVEYLGPVARLHVAARAAPGVELRVDLPKRAFHAGEMQPGQVVEVALAPEEIRTFPC